MSGVAANRREAVNPPGLYEAVPFGFSHAVMQTGGRTLHLAGQTAWNEARELVGVQGEAERRPGQVVA